MMPRTLLAVAAVLLVAPAAAAQDHDPDQAVKGGAFPPGWTGRTDRGQPLDDVNFRAMGAGLHVTLGPSSILYREADAASGAYEVSATITQTKAPTHPEAYGLFIGGRDLQGADQAYTYFLIRANGQFLVKRRAGSQTSDVASWTANPAVKAQDEAGKATNTLSIAVGADRVRFLVNGTEVHSAPRSEVDPDGIAGLRVNHNLDLHIDGFGVKR
jgi:hypothetical protein